MGIEQIIFYVFSAIMLGSALMVVTTKNTVRAALFLVLSFFSGAVIWLLLEAEFLGIALVLVYVGAVAVLFLFVVMMLDIEYSSVRARFAQHLPIGLTVAIMALGSLLYVVGGEWFGVDSFPVPEKHGVEYSNIEALGEVLYTEYFYPFELAAVILLVAIIAAIALTFRGPKNRKTQVVAEQVAVRPEDVVYLTDLKD